MFMTPLQVEKVGKNKWKLLAPLVWMGAETYIVDAGFVTDFASVPQIAWWFCAPAAGNHAKPAVLHDYLCVNYDDQSHTDKVFLEAMESNGVGWFKRSAMYNAVRAYQAAKGKY